MKITTTNGLSLLIDADAGTIGFISPGFTLPSLVLSEKDVVFPQGPMPISQNAVRDALTEARCYSDILSERSNELIRTVIRIVHDRPPYRLNPTSVVQDMTCVSADGERVFGVTVTSCEQAEQIVVRDMSTDQPVLIVEAGEYDAINEMTVAVRDETLDADMLTLLRFLSSHSEVALRSQRFIGDVITRLTEVAQ